jgi:hypothetical protein
VLFYGGVEGKQTAKIEKVTALVPRVEKAAEMPVAEAFRRVCRILQPFRGTFHLRNAG